MSRASRAVVFSLPWLVMFAWAREPAPVVLRVNDFYVIYTLPIAPYLDSAGRVMVPLSGFAELIQDWEIARQKQIQEWQWWRGYHGWLPKSRDSRGDWEAPGHDFTASPSPPLRYHEGGRATLSFAGTVLLFVAGKAEIQIVGEARSVPLPAPPRVLPGGELVVPLRPLAAALGIAVTWDPSVKMARIEDWRFLYQDQMNAVDWAKRPRTEALLPTHYRITQLPKWGEGECHPDKFGPLGIMPTWEATGKCYKLEVWVRDQSQSGIPAEAEGIFIIYGTIFAGRQHIPYPPVTAALTPPGGPCAPVKGGFHCSLAMQQPPSAPLLALMTIDPGKLN